MVENLRNNKELVLVQTFNQLMLKAVNVFVC